MQSDFETAYRAARRQYELGRLATAGRHAALATMAVGALSALVIGRDALVWLPATFLAVTLSEWRGVALMRGARRGFVAGAVSMLLPLSVLRPCCGMDAKAMGVSCCVMPSACWGAGALMGLAMALVLPKVPEGRRAEAAFGMILGVTSVTLLRCSMLFVGEAVGLLGGIAAGVAASSLARALLDRRRTA